jgi:hypothetical protein
MGIYLLAEDQEYLVESVTKTNLNN